MTRERDFGRDAAMVVGGIAAGVFASRLLPPLVAAVAGSKRVRAGSDPFELLIEDHRQILSLLNEMAEVRTSDTIRRTKLFWMFKRKLAKHALAEEDVVYPIVHNDSASGNERKHLYDEHAEMKILLYELENQLKSKENWSEIVTRLRDLIRSHVDEEEKSIFPEMRREMNKSKLPAVSALISREEALIL